MSRVLLVEDNEDLALGLRNNLEIEGYEVRSAITGEQALHEIEARPELVILDLMLPDMSGLAVLKEARRRGFGGAVLVLTARGEEADKVRGLRLGADDYLTKPFGLLELLARVEALLRRGSLKPRPRREPHPRQTRHPPGPARGAPGNRTDRADTQGVRPAARPGTGPGGRGQSA